MIDAVPVNPPPSVAVIVKVIVFPGPVAASWSRAEMVTTPVAEFILE